MLSPDARLARILDAACKAAGVPRMRVHDLRHAHASLWLMAGGSLADVQRNLGHSTPMLTSETYGHIAEDHRIREVDQRLALGIGRAGPKAVPAISQDAAAASETLAEGA
jgi:integrase